MLLTETDASFQPVIIAYSCSSAPSRTIVREYVFCVYSESKTRFFTFFEVPCQKRKKRYSKFSLFALKFEITN